MEKQVTLSLEAQEVLKRVNSKIGQVEDGIVKCLEHELENGVIYAMEWNRLFYRVQLSHLKNSLLSLKDGIEHGAPHSEILAHHKKMCMSLIMRKDNISTSPGKNQSESLKVEAMKEMVEFIESLQATF